MALRPTLRPTWRRLSLGLTTLLGLRRAGWFIPYRYADGLPLPGTLPPYAAIARRFAAAEPAFREVVRAIEDHAAALLRIAHGEPPAAAAWPGPPARFDQG